MEPIETATMSERGQIIIPKDIRNYIGATENTIFTIGAIDEDTIVMKKLDTERTLEEFRKLRSQTRTISRKDIAKEIKAVRKEKRDTR